MAITFLLEEVDFFSKIKRAINYGYVTEIFDVFTSQIDDWIVLISDRFIELHVLFGGISSNIDFGPLFLLSNVGAVYTTIFLLFIFMLILKAENVYERLALYVILVGNHPLPCYVLCTYGVRLPITHPQNSVCS